MQTRERGRRYVSIRTHHSLTELSRMMNKFERLFGLKGEARVKYMAGEYQVAVPGDFVICGVTGQPIAMGELRYWNVELQEPYISAEASLERYRQRRKRPKA